MKRLQQILALGMALLLAGCAATSPDKDFDAHRSQYRAFTGPTDEPSDGGTDATFYLDGCQVRKIAWSIATSQRIIDCDYYFRDGKPVLVVETSHFLLDEHAERLKTPRFEYTRSYHLDEPGKVPAGKKTDYEAHAAYLLRYFAQHREEFTPASSLR